MHVHNFDAAIHNVGADRLSVHGLQEDNRFRRTRRIGNTDDRQCPLRVGDIDRRVLIIVMPFLECVDPVGIDPRSRRRSIAVYCRFESARVMKRRMGNITGNDNGILSCGNLGYSEM